MKLKTWFLWLCVLALLAGECFLYLANRQKDAALASSREAQHQLAQLQARLGQTVSNTTNQNAEIARLRQEKAKVSENLSRLQGRLDRLRATNRQLTAELADAHSNVLQLQGQLQELQLLSQQTQAESGPPQTENPPPAAEQPLSAEAARKQCRANLRLIDEAKQLWALEHNKTDKDVPTADDLAPYFPDGTFPVCPSGGTYHINAVGEPPACSIHGRAPGR